MAGTESDFQKQIECGVEIQKVSECGVESEKVSENGVGIQRVSKSENVIQSQNEILPPHEPFHDENESRLQKNLPLAKERQSCGRSRERVDESPRLPWLKARC